MRAERPLGFAIIGAGFMGSTHALAVAAIPQARVVVICARNERAGRALAESCEADWTPDYQAAITRADVDVVSVCTPSGFHLEPAELAARSGKHLLVEKPLEVTVDRADRLIAAADAAGVKLAGIFPYRFLSGVDKARAAVTQGRLGRLTVASCSVLWNRSQDYYRGSWHGTWLLDGGGALINQSIHSIDLLQYLAGPVKLVVGRIGTLAHDIEAEDTAAAVLTFDSGALGTIQASTGSWPGDQARVELHGSEGTISLVEGHIASWKLEDAEADEEEAMLRLEQPTSSGARAASGFQTYELHRRQIDDLIRAIQEDRQPAVDGREARKAVEIVQAVYQSAQAGHPVTLPLK